jgi:hypothetical protein
MSDVGYTLEALHDGSSERIVSLRLPEAQAHQIMRELWSNVDFWAAPGGGSVRVRTDLEADTINRVLGTCHITFAPGRHRWHFHVHLV